MEEKDKELDFNDSLIQETEKIACLIKEEGIRPDNIDFLSKLVDIHKDMSKEKYMKEEKEMRYRGYGEYGEYGAGNNYGRRGVAGTGRGRYNNGGSYGRRGVDAKYRGEEMLDEMSYHYGNYHDSYNNGNYGAKEDSAKKMTDAFVEFGYAISEELEPNEKMMFKQAMGQIMQELDR